MAFPSPSLDKDKTDVRVGVDGAEIVVDDDVIIKDVLDAGTIGIGALLDGVDR